ncbi:vWA domain-containing protein [Streptomyces sp. 4N124]|uniref:vWA domain-containing protein n=1 Tax=Streptomyces sp. 4N124 TaxID=3457420 RepID=UPI003FD5E85F
MTTIHAQAERDDRPPVLPIYVAGDVSLSMEGEPIRALNEMLETFRIGLINNPEAGDVARLAMLSFSDTAKLDVPLTDVVDIKAMPTLTAVASTAYGAVFDLLASDIPSSVLALKGAGHRVYRPSVFLITDGQPNDDETFRWAAYQRLVAPENRWRPNIAVFGLGTADREMCRKIARGRGKAYFPSSGMDDVADSLKKLIPEIMKSVIKSTGTAATGGAPQPPFPEHVPGFDTCDPLDEV